MGLSGVGHVDRNEAACRAFQGVALEGFLENDVHRHLESYCIGGPGMYVALH